MIWFENSVFSVQHIGNRKSDQAYPFAYSCGSTLHTSYKNDMIGQRGKGANIVKTCSLLSIYNGMYTHVYSMYTVCSYNTSQQTTY